MYTAGPRLRRIFDSSRAPASDVADRLPRIFEDHNLAGFREMAPAIAAERAPVAGGLVQPHGWDRSTATSGNSSGEP
jgi:hypothetical protein